MVRIPQHAHLYLDFSPVSALARPPTAHLPTPQPPTPASHHELDHQSSWQEWTSVALAQLPHMLVVTGPLPHTALWLTA